MDKKAFQLGYALSQLESLEAHWASKAQQTVLPDGTMLSEGAQRYNASMAERISKIRQAVEAFVA